MKLSAYYKSRGYRVLLSRDSSYVKADRYAASAIFATGKTVRKVAALESIYGSEINIGGSGVSLKKRLDPAVESCFPDYGLYRHNRYAIGYLTRGCNKRCPFCIVPQKEGRVSRRVASFDDFVPKGQRRVMLLDDNLLSCPGAEELLAEMHLRRYSVNFNQSLDIAYLNGRTFRLLEKIDSRNARFTKRMFYFACNGTNDINMFVERRDLLQRFGEDCVTVLTLYGFNTRLSEDYRRFLMLRRLRLIPFFLEYQPVADVAARVPEDFFDMDLDALIRLTFRSNGQNWEKYLRWVSRLYFLTFGRLYLPLLKIIYRYNRKENIRKFLDRPELLTSELYRTYEKLPDPDSRIAQLANGTAKRSRRRARS